MEKLLDAFFKRPLLIIVIIFVLGIYVSGIVNPGPFFWVGAGFFILLAAAAGILTGYFKTGWLLLAAAFIGGLFSGSLAYEGINQDLLKYSGHYVVIKGEVDRAPEYRRDSVDYVLRVDSVQAGSSREKLSGRVLMRVQGTNQKYTYGDVLRAKGLMYRPASPGNPGEFDYREYLKRRGIPAVLNVENGSVEKTGGSFPGFRGTALFLRDKIMQQNRDSLPPVQGAVLNGIMFGARGEIPREIEDAFAESGLSHILCVSGLHAGLVLGGILLLLNQLGVSRSRFPLVVTPVLLFYAAMTGLGPAVCRAVIMALMLLWAHRLGRERDWPTTLAAAAFLILLANPLQLYEAGFQLSFAATWGILYLGPVIKQKLGYISFLPGAAKEILQVTLAAQLATLPIAAAHFNLVSFISLLTNMIAVPVTGLVLLMGLAAGLTGFIIPFCGELVNAGTGILLGLLTGTVSYTGNIPLAYRYVPAWPWWCIVLWYAGLVALVEGAVVKRFRAARNRPGFIILPAAIVFLLLLLLGPAHSSDILEVHFIDVGQGDSILVNTPGGKNMLVDAGGWRGEWQGEPGAGDYIVVPYLKRQGINRLDVLALSHFHEDHAGGAGAVLQKVGAKRLVIPAVEEEAFQEPGVKSLLDTAVKEGASINRASAGDRLILGDGLEISFLGPPAGAQERTAAGLNNNSLVMLLSYRQVQVLLTGDIEEEMQSRLVRKGDLQEVEVLKVPHHGSASFDPGFIKETSPRIAVISLGERNTFGLPDAGLINQLQRAGASIYRTDRDGAVIIKTGGRKISLHTGK